MQENIYLLIKQKETVQDEIFLVFSMSKAHYKIEGSLDRMRGQFVT